MTTTTRDKPATRDIAAEKRDDHPERPGAGNTPADQGVGHDERGRYGRSDHDAGSPEPYRP